MKNIPLILLFLMLLVGMLLINPRKPFICKQTYKASLFEPSKDADCGGLYLLDSLVPYMKDTAVYKLHRDGRFLVVEKNKTAPLDQFREKLFGKKASNSDQIRRLSCLDSTGLNIRMEGGNYECPEKIYLRLEFNDEKQFVFIPNIILYHLFNKGSE